MLNILFILYIIQYMYYVLSTIILNRFNFHVFGMVLSLNLNYYYIYLYIIEIKNVYKIIRVVFIDYIL